MTLSLSATPPRRSATIKDVARLSGFSTSTVSRALTASSHVDPKTRDLIQAVARDLGYRPDAAARTLVTSRSNVIGVAFLTFDASRRLHHPFLQELFEGMQLRASSCGYDILLLGGRRDGSTWDALHRRLDGVVLLAADDDARGLQALAQSGTPTVGIDVDVRGIDPSFGFVTSDNRAGARLAVEHLVELGRTRIACVAGGVDTPPGRERLLGYREALAAAGLPVREEYVIPGDFDRRSGRRAVNGLLSLREPPDAIFATSDIAALGAIDALLDAAVAIPDEVALVGFDDIAVSSFMRPTLTTVRQNQDGLGEAAIAMLVDLIRDPESAQLLHVEPVQLEVRQTTAPRFAQPVAPELVSSSAL